MSLLQTYQRLREAEDATDHEEFGEACNCLLRALHETDPQSYLDCIAWDVGRAVPPSMREAGA